MEWIYVSIYISNNAFNLYDWLLSLRLKIQFTRDVGNFYNFYHCNYV